MPNELRTEVEQVKQQEEGRRALKQTSIVKPDETPKAEKLVINTGTTIITFLMVFLIQNTQNRDAKAIHLKLDELLRSKRRAHQFGRSGNPLSDEELEKLHAQFKRIRHIEGEDTRATGELAAQEE